MSSWNHKLDPDLTNFHVRQQDVQWLQTITSMPILVKGVLTGEDGELKSDKQMFSIILVS